ncbi:MAG: Ni/Fe hydrogenase subunit alpha [Myxococcota bacterium]
MTMATDERVFKVDLLTRVEGEGRFSLVVRDGQVVEAKLAIFEAPRFFEAFLRGRSIYEVPDIVARICGICPVAYQMSAVRALEMALDVAPPPAIVALRRLLYCGEWIESHALHVFLLHAPDFLGYPSAVEMAADHKDVVERGLRIKKAGNALIELLGGRAIHPVSVRVGGFTRVPSPAELRVIRPRLVDALQDAIGATAWANALPMPPFEQDYVFVALDAARYPMEQGDRVLVSGRAAVPVADWEATFIESQVEHSNALQCRLPDGTPYLCGPLARLYHHADKLHPIAARALADTGITLPIRNPYLSIVARCVELVHAFSEALDLVDAWAGAHPAYVDSPPRDATGFGATEAPRGILWHRYDIRADGTVASASIVPPTSQNQARIEADLTAIASELLTLDLAAATLLCEQLIRSYDPCISCATHFLELNIDRGEG